MGVFTSKATGNTSSTGATTWNEASKPAYGDTVHISTSHVITVDENSTWGIDAAGVTEAWPATLPTWAATGGSTPTNLATTTYYLVLVPVDANGREMTASRETTSAVSITNGVSQPIITLPSLPTGGVSWSIYLAPYSAGAGQYHTRRYATGVTGSSYEPVNALWENNTVAYGTSAKHCSQGSAVMCRGQLVIPDGVTLTLKGDLRYAGTLGISMQAGGSLILDGSAVSANYRFIGGDNNYSPFVAVGTYAKPCIIKAADAGPVAYFGVNQYLNGNFRFDYTRFTRIGDLNTAAIRFYPASKATCSYRMYRCRFDNCGKVQATTTPPTDFEILIQGTEFRNTPGGAVNGRNLEIANMPTATGGAARTITENVFDAQAYIMKADMTKNYIGSPLWNTQPTTFSDNLLCLTDGTSRQYISTGTSPSSNYIYFNSPQYRNPHWIIPLQDNADNAWTNCIFEFNGIDWSGDIFLLSTAATPSSTHTITITNCLFLPNPVADDSGTPVTAYGNSHTQIVFDHNTYMMGQQGLSIGEAYDGVAGMWQSIRSNIAWNPADRGPAGHGWKVSAGLGGHTATVCPANYIVVADYNCGWNFSTDGWTVGESGINNTYLALGYHVSSTTDPFTTPPGAHDINEDPEFVDYTRCMATFDRGYLGHTSTDADGNAILTWSAGVSFAVGDTIALARTGYFFDETVNYRCKVAHTSSATGDLRYNAPYDPTGSIQYFNATISSSTWSYIFRDTSGNDSTATSSLNYNDSAATIASAVQTLVRSFMSDSGIDVACSGKISDGPITLTFTKSGSPYQVGNGMITKADGTRYIASCWDDTWEFASLYSIRKPVADAHETGTMPTITDAALGLSGATYIEAVMAWIFAGWAPTNTALKDAGHDGVTMGAVEWVAAAVPPTSTGPLTIGMGYGMRMFGPNEDIIIGVQ